MAREGSGKMCKKCPKHKDRKVHCKGLCRSCYEKQLRENNPEFAERQRENRREWAEQHPEEIKKIWERRKKDPRCRARDKLTKYRKSLVKRGLTEQTATLLLERQGNRCAICGRDFSICTKHLDHDYDTELARGYLCSRCNNGLGMFEESVKMLTTAIQYLKQYPAREFIKK
jgi:hypothetical protein